MTDQTPRNSPPQLPLPADGSAHDPASAGDPTPRRGLPRWAWALIAAGGLVFIGIAAAFVVTASHVFGTPPAADCDNDRCNSEGTAITKGKSTRSPAPLAGGVEHIPLTTLAVFEGQPVWAWQMTPDWTHVTFDDNGVNVWQHDETGCSLITSQTVASQMAESPTDSIPSEEMVDGVIEAYADKGPEASVLDAGTIDVTFSTTQGESAIEFATGTLALTLPTGEHQVAEVIARSMPDSGTSLVATMTCDPAVHAAAAEPYGQLRTILAVIIYP
ncbi:hypothetical protein I6E74_03520 [Salinibacterium sp. SWN139]|uniref:hypothetical protein n=1 Tax=Salinibacterium sp. SWN139 TaxID=2792055 RepID=UPI0018CD46CC|nr:hypothetical protein [Salinibacterium sp. SWN139]MBH0053236.1 hypothetical protein [Salinibacterium sp. SWN139]